MDKLIMATDGSYSPSLSKGGIGIVIADENGKVLHKASKQFVSKTGIPFTDLSNQKMEITAMMCALYLINKPLKSLTVYTDSAYVLGNLTQNWKRKKNVELLSKLDKLKERAQSFVETPIEFKWVKGHAKGNSIESTLNNICDELAQSATQSI